MLLFVLIYPFNILWLPAITLLWQGPGAPWRQWGPATCQALWCKVWARVLLPGGDSEVTGKGGGLGMGQVEMSPQEVSYKL